MDKTIGKYQFRGQGGSVLWVLSLHIMSLAVWSASVLYVAALLLARARHQQPEFAGAEAVFSDTPRGIDSIARFVFTHVACPAAIISISAGSAVFLLNQSQPFWLLVKLTLVTLLCLTQAMMGLVIIRAERGNFKWMRLSSRGFLLLLSILMIAIVWIVLGKPDAPGWVEQWG